MHALQGKAGVERSLNSHRSLRRRKRERNFGLFWARMKAEQMKAEKLAMERAAVEAQKRAEKEAAQRAAEEALKKKAAEEKSRTGGVVGECFT
ncbi:uncharacterized protein LOC116259152 isoform X1 [Nymphaea colorata]|nr:uncharacterized protein LOC116259152 isoform X1 [Nymphaea colorata]XP_049934916.1 uncharacterized protein LOC116259152 isoform X1 [Nymphaea colorata]